MTRIMCSGTYHSKGMGLMTRNLFLTVCCLKDKSIFPMQKTEIKVFPAGLGGQGQLILFQTSFRASLILPDPAFAYVLSVGSTALLCSCGSSCAQQPFHRDASSPFALCPLCIKCCSSAGLRSFLWQCSTRREICARCCLCLMSVVRSREKLFSTSFLIF